MKNSNNHRTIEPGGDQNIFKPIRLLSGIIFAGASLFAFVFGQNLFVATRTFRVVSGPEFVQSPQPGNTTLRGRFEYFSGVKVVETRKGQETIGTRYYTVFRISRTNRVIYVLQDFNMTFTLLGHGTKETDLKGHVSEISADEFAWMQRNVPPLVSYTDRAPNFIRPPGHDLNATVYALADNFLADYANQHSKKAEPVPNVVFDMRNQTMTGADPMMLAFFSVVAIIAGILFVLSWKKWPAKSALGDRGMSQFGGPDTEGINIYLEEQDAVRMRAITDPDFGLFHACQTNNEIFAKMKLDEGANPNTKQAGGFTPLLAAIIEGNSNLVNLLLQSGADSDLANERGSTPLMAAAEKANPEILGLLIATGAKLNLQNLEGATALHLAAAHGHAAVVEILLDAGADTTIKDNMDLFEKIVEQKRREGQELLFEAGNRDLLKGLTAAQVARAADHTEICKND